MAKTPELDVLAIAAHPDDTEITCGGLLIKSVSMGRKAGALDLARGEMGTHGNEEDRERELTKAAEIMGLSWRGNLAMPDSAIEINQDNKLKIAQVIRNTRAKMVILPHWEQRHPDHHACSRLGYDACYLAGLKKIDLEGEPHRPHKILYASYRRNRDYSFLVDISDFMEKKLEAIAAYQSQFGTELTVQDILSMGPKERWERSQDERTDIFHPGVTVFDLVLSWQSALGQLAGVRYAEAYTITERILIDDPQNMPVRSI